MKAKTIILSVFIALMVCSCSSKDPVSTGGATHELTFAKISTVESGAVKFDIYSASGTGMYYGYNDIGFKVYVSGTEQTTGYCKYRPMMYHSLGGPGHSSPVPDKYYYDTEYNLFKGYVCFTMISDSSSFWYADYIYNDVNSVDSAYFYVGVTQGRQLFYWDDVWGGHTYCLTLIKPFNPSSGLNTFAMMLHRTNDDKNFIEIDSAQMTLKTYFQSSGEVSTGNINPVRTGNGRYQGTINLTKSGNWLVQDTISINGNKITKNPPPDFLFTLN
jgi:hypothetical protein